MPYNKALSIIIVAHNREELTRQCFEALCRAEMPQSCEVLLVGNGCSDGTPAIPAEFSSRLKDVRYLNDHHNVSYAHANNEAARIARGCRLLFLNNDVMVAPASLACILKAMDDDKTVGATGVKLLYPDTGAIQHAGMFQMLWGYASNYGVGGRADDPRFAASREVFAVTGAMLCVDRDLFEKVDGFDEDFWFGYEDVDLCLKIRKAGKKIIYLPQAASVHQESATLGTFRSSEAAEANYNHYRFKWDPVLVPAEQGYLAGLRKQGIRKTVVFGTGAAAAGLFQSLTQAGVQVVAFSSSADTKPACQHYFDRPIVVLDDLAHMDFDRIIVGSQYFFQVEELLSRYDPAGGAVFPVIS
jgi:GT2 family glycosyltransferase